MTLTFTPYRAQDRPDCLRVFDSNVPRFFRQPERRDLETFLDSSGCPYFVVRRGAQVVGCGGYGIREGSAVADLCWGMVASEHHGTGLGEFLLLLRLNEILTLQDVRGVRLGTSQHTDGFFRKYGFAVRSRQRNGIDDGLDSVEMELNLTPDVRRRIAERWRRLSNDPPL